jgi:hypothetical protein
VEVYVYGWEFSQSTAQCSERLHPHHETVSTTCFHLPSAVVHVPPRPFNTADITSTILLAIFSALDGMIHLVLHVVSSRGGSCTCDKGDDTVTRYVIMCS